MKKFALIPVMFCFFAMGFVDLVGIASNYVKEDLQLTDSGGHCIQLCEGRPAVDRLRSQHLPFARILLVPHLQCANGYADEQDRT